jgi:hypothetical protein
LPSSFSLFNPIYGHFFKVNILYSCIHCSNKMYLLTNLFLWKNIRIAKGVLPFMV